MSSSGSAEQLAPGWRILLTGRWAISFRAWLVIAVLMQWPSYARNSVPSDLSPAWAITIGLLRVLAAGLVLWAADRTYLRRRAAQPAALSVVVATWLAAGAATMAVQWAAFELLDEPGISPLRWVASSITFALRSALCAYYFGLREYWTMSVEGLRASTQQLSALQASSAAELQQVRGRVRAIVVDQVLPSMRRLQSDLGGDTNAMGRDRLEELSRIASTYSQDVVREASHQVSNLPTGPGAETTSPGEAPLASPIATARAPLLVSVRWSALVFGVTLVPLAFTAPPDDDVLPILLGIAVLIALLSLGAWIQQRPAGAARTTFASTVWMAGTAVVGVGTQAAAGLLPARVTAPVPLISLVIIVFAAAMLGSSMERHLRGIAAQAQQLSVVLEDVARINNALQEELAAEKRRVALLLHGPVQGRLAAVALLLKLDNDRDDPVDGGTETRARCRIILDQVMDDLTSVVEGTFEEGQPLEDRLAQLSQNWHGIASVTVRMAPDLPHVLAGDPGLRQWIFEIVDEGINNAVTHGHATSVDVRVVATPDRVNVMVADNGAGLEPTAGHGLGLSTIGRSPAHLTLTPTPTGGALLTVSLPCGS